MAILITGGAGYIGSVTTELLRARGAEVVVLDNLSRGFRDAVAPDIPFYQGEAGNGALLRNIILDHKIDACIHFAAFAYVSESVANPELYYGNNVVHGIQLLRALEHGGVNRFVFSSTCATYGEPQSIPISEEHPQVPTNPYGWSKLFLERVLTDYERPYGLRFVALRYFNAAGATRERGERHNPETHLIPLVLQAAHRKTMNVKVFGNDYPTKDGTCVRDYIHVSDLADAHIRALDYLEAGNPSTAINLGTGHGYSVLEVIETARKVTGREIKIDMRGRRPGDPSHLVADAAKARAVLGWQPQHDLTAIIGSANEWLQKRFK